MRSLRKKRVNLHRRTPLPKVSDSDECPLPHSIIMLTLLEPQSSPVLGTNQSNFK